MKGWHLADWVPREADVTLNVRRKHNHGLHGCGLCKDLSRVIASLVTTLAIVDHQLGRFGREVGHAVLGCLARSAMMLAILDAT